MNFQRTNLKTSNMSETRKFQQKMLGRWDFLIFLLLGLFIWGITYYVLGLLDTGSKPQYQWNWNRVFQFLVYRVPEPNGKIQAGPLIEGLLSTIKLAFYSIVMGLLIGVPVGILQVQKLRLLRLMGQFYVELIRNMPPLVVVTIFYFFFASPLVEWLQLEALSRNASPMLRSVLGFLFDMGSKQNNLILGNFFAAVIILGIYEGSYIAEIIRAGIQAIPPGQHKAAFSLGFSVWQNYLLVILPQVIRSQLPALTNQCISAIKDSAIVSLISIQELTFRSKQVITTTRAFVESSIILLFLYLLITGFCAYIASRLIKYYKIS